MQESFYKELYRLMNESKYAVNRRGIGALYAVATARQDEGFENFVDQVECLSDIQFHEPEEYPQTECAAKLLRHIGDMIE